MEGNEYMLKQIPLTISKYETEALEKVNASNSRIGLFQGKVEIPKDFAVTIKFDFSRSKHEINKLFLFKYLVFPPFVKEVIRKSELTTQMIFDLWETEKDRNEFLIDELLIYQKVLSYKSLIKNLSPKEKWVVFTQNIHRTKEQMADYEEDVVDLFTFFLIEYLTDENLSRFQQVYGEWRRLCLETIEKYYSGIVFEKIIQKANNQLEIKILAVQKDLAKHQLIKRILAEYEASEEEKASLAEVLLEYTNKIFDLQKKQHALEAVKERIENFLIK